MVGVRPFGLRCEEEGGLEMREETEGEEMRVEVWMRRWDLRVVTLALRDSISASSGEGVVDKGVGENMVRLVEGPAFGIE